jgi:hypothetical protein
MTLTTRALAQAERLADLFCPVTPVQTAAQQRLTEAIRAGDLPGAVEAMNAMRPEPLATAEWRSWADSWLGKVERLAVGNG